MGMDAASQHDGHRERLRERYQKAGLKDFAPHEVLELLLTFAIPRVDVNPISHRLIRRFGSLAAVLEASPEELQQVEGVGPRAAALLSMMVPLFQQYELSRLLPREQLNNFGQMIAYCCALFLGDSNESFYMVSLDARLNVLAAEQISRGTPTEVSVIPRTVVREALRRNAVGVVITHNHPSGACTPSQEDVDVTEEIRSALASVGIQLYDHVIVAGYDQYSFRRNGLLEQEEDGIGIAPALPLAADRPQRSLPVRRKKQTKDEK